MRARGARWRVADVRSFEACHIVTLSGASSKDFGIERRLLEPFDTIEMVDRAAAPMVVAGSRWRNACRALLAADAPPGGLRQARWARIDLLPHQLEPALAVMAGRGTRVLLADDVGLGKTIQAGLILAELRARGWIDRVLVVTPAGLRDQWTHELAARFGIEATVLDASSLKRRAAALPIGLNPWSTIPLAVTSTDYVKRAEVLPAAAACRWDAIVVDEAHGVAGDSDRRAAVEALASRASYVLLLTATPHSGDAAAFRSLCAIGSTGEPLIAFRRRRSEIRGGNPRRIRTLAVRPSAAERRMHAALAAYSNAVRAEHRGGASMWLALSVLHKRAFSGAWALGQSVARRLDALDNSHEAPDARQIALPLDDPAGELTAADQPPEWPNELKLTDTERERRLLAAVMDACRAAVAAERKVAALGRLLRRAKESVIVFTEYRDTLLHLRQSLGGGAAVVLHGGMTRDERTRAIAAFERTPGTVLLATDAAGEGLNLQRTCRLVVNIELPWNPMRLEQRIGRVDRLGQGRVVHACHLVARGTNEMRILDRLRSRVARAHGEIGGPNPLGAAAPELDEDRIARLAVSGEWLEQPSSDRAANVEPPNAVQVISDLRDSAATEADRLRRARSLSIRRMDVVAERPSIVRASRRWLRRAIGPKALLVWHAAFADAAGLVVESRLVAVTIGGTPRARNRTELRALAQALGERLPETIEASLGAWRAAATESIDSLAAARLARERRILSTLAARSRTQLQPGLFDTRAIRAYEQHTRFLDDLARQLADRVARIERGSSVRRLAPALVLAALP